MVSNSCAWLAAAAVALAGAGCSSEPFDRMTQTAPSNASAAGAQGDVAATQAQPASDAALRAKVEDALAAEPALHGSKIGVSSADGVVTLTGSTPDSQLRSMAAHVALSVEGVKHVRNEITLAHDA